MHLAAAFGNTKTLTALRQAGAAIEAITKQCKTPLHEAARWGKAESVTALLKAGANGKAIDKGGNTPFDRAKYNDALNGTDAYRMLNEGRD